MTTDGSLKALCPRCGVSGDNATHDAIAEGPGRSASSLSGSVTTMSRIGQFGSGMSSKGSLGGTGCELRGVVRIGHAGSCVLMARLSSILKDVTQNDIPDRSVLLAVVAAIAPSRSNDATEYTGCPIELSKPSNTLLQQRLAPVLVAHMSNEASI